jgi:hypothetical protein
MARCRATSLGFPVTVTETLAETPCLRGFRRGLIPDLARFWLHRHPTGTAPDTAIKNDRRISGSQGDRVVQIGVHRGITCAGA